MLACHSCNVPLEEGARFCPQCGLQQESALDRIGPSVQLDVGWGRVVVGEPIGEGGMGVVHRGWLYYDPQGPRAGTPPHPIAIKALHPMLSGRERARRLFESEAAALDRLRHPNVVHFFGLTTHQEQLALLLEFVDGQPLNEVIDRHVHRARLDGIPAMPFLRTWYYFSQLLGALAAIHALGILHRDVKPSNVLVRRDGVVKLTDFGIARLPEASARHTGGMAPGTGAYMAPEQVLAEELDARSDLYSAAIVLYEMLTGLTPFDSPERTEIMVRAAQVEQTPAPITQLVPQAPEVLDVLMARALAKSKMHRFGSALEMGEAFRRALGLPESPGWSAQQAMVQHAKAVSRAIQRETQGLPSRDGEGKATEEGAASRRARTTILSAYGTGDDGD